MENSIDREINGRHVFKDFLFFFFVFLLMMNFAVILWLNLLNYLLSV